MTQTKPQSLQRVTQRIEEALEALIEERGLTAGERLPSERALAELLGASRNSLREALMRLGARGRITLRKGGNTVAEPVEARWTRATIAEPLYSAIVSNPGYGHDVLEVRHGLEGQAAFYAAQRAAANDRDHIRRCFEAMSECHEKGDATAEAHADAAFHLSIADASHNAVLRSVMSSMFGLMQTSISESLDKLYTVPRTFERLSEQHSLLVATIVAGDPDAARKAADEHLAFVAKTVRGIDEERARRDRVETLRLASSLASHLKG